MAIDKKENINKTSVTPTILDSVINMLGNHLVVIITSLTGKLFRIRLTIYLLKRLT